MGRVFLEFSWVVLGMLKDLAGELGVAVGVLPVVVYLKSGTGTVGVSSHFRLDR